MGRPRAPARGSERAPLDPAEQGRARARRAATHEWSAALTIPHDKVRVSFAVPGRGMLLLGTTDTLFEGEPDEVSVSQARRRPGARRGLCRAAAGARPPRARARHVRRAARPARRRRGDGERAPRDRLLARPGRDAQRRRRQAHDLPADRPGRARPSAVGSRAAPARQARAAAARARSGSTAYSFPDELAPAVRSHLLHLYGSLAPEVLAPAADDPSLLEPLRPGGPDLAAQALYARTHEWAVTDEDVLRRRTTVWLRGDRVAEHAATP